MADDRVSDALASDAPLTAAVPQHEIAKEAADAVGWDKAALFGRTVTINRPREAVYGLWRDFENLPRFMQNVVSVADLGGGRSHWVIAAPAGRIVEWDAVLTADEPGQLLAWDSEPGADIKNSGRIEFRDAPGGRGTEVSATIIYEPPGGDLGMLIAKLFQKEPKMQARRELRRFKQFAETGEVSTSAAPDAAPRG
jgi:uncharacterized membrane protein